MPKYLAFVGDWVGDLINHGEILGTGSSTTEVLGKELALVNFAVTPHKGPAHPGTTKPATLIVGSPIVEVGEKGVTFIGDIASCGCPVIHGPVLSPDQRELIQVDA